MKDQSFLNHPLGLTGIDALSTAWAASVPSFKNIEQPAWPTMLQALRTMQLPDGGWGEKTILNAHDRFICTLSAIWVFSIWDYPDDQERIEKGKALLNHYAKQIQFESRDLVGFEFTIDKFVKALHDKGIKIEASCLEKFSEVRKLSTNSKRLLEPDISKPEAWWFCLECLPEAMLNNLDPKFISKKGGIVTSTASTAAYLSAIRKAKQDNPQAVQYLTKVMSMTKHGIGFCWPLDITQLIWSLDSYLKIGLSPNLPFMQKYLQILYNQWITIPEGITLSGYFPVQDADDLSLAYSVLSQGGYPVSIEPLLKFWNGSAMTCYIGERETSTALSVNIHALQALRDNCRLKNEKRYDEIMSKILAWIDNKFKTDPLLIDKWHISPTYCLGRAIPVLKDLAPELAKWCIEKLLSDQREDGGWGYFGISTEEETAHSILGLLDAYQSNFLNSRAPLKRAAEFLYSQHSNMLSRPRLWLSKSLYLPVNMVEAFIHCAHIGLEKIELGDSRKRYKRQYDYTA